METLVAESRLPAAKMPEERNSGLDWLLPSTGFIEKPAKEACGEIFCSETWGRTAARSKKLRPLSGRSCTSLLTIVPATSAVEVSIISAPAAETVTDSLTSPTWRTTSTCAVCDTCATRFLTSALLNPECDTLMS